MADKDIRELITPLPMKDAPTSGEEILVCFNGDPVFYPAKYISVKNHWGESGWCFSDEETMHYSRHPIRPDGWALMPYVNETDKP